MRTSFFPGLLALVSGALLCGSLTAVAQSDAATTKPHQPMIFGFQDPQTGVFHPASAAIADTSTPPTNGTVQLTITITLKTPVPAGGAVGCSASVHGSEFETVSPFTSTDYEETAYKMATISGSTATCVVKVPYSWHFPSSTNPTSSFTGAYEIEMVNATSALPPVLRLSASAFVNSTTIPPPNTYSTYTVSATI
jgi:hypothetical protein